MSNCQHIRCEPYRTCQLGAQVTLQCRSLEDARAVAIEASRDDGMHSARSEDDRVILTYYDKRYPLDVAEWAFNNGHCDDSAAGDVIERL